MWVWPNMGVFFYHLIEPEQEPITWSVQLPYWTYVTAFSQNGLILNYLFAENRLLELTWVIRSMKREEKKMASLCGDVFMSKLRKFRLSFAVFQYSNPFFPYITLSFANFSHLRKKFAGARIIVVFLFVFVFFFFVFFWFWPL